MENERETKERETEMIFFSSLFCFSKLGNSFFNGSSCSFLSSDGNLLRFMSSSWDGDGFLHSSASLGRGRHGPLEQRGGLR